MTNPSQAEHLLYIPLNVSKTWLSVKLRGK